MPAVTQEDYEAREAFMLEARDLGSAARDAARRLAEVRRGASGERARELEALESRVRPALFGVQGAYRSLNGGGVRQGSLHRPTRTQFEQLADARQALAEVLQALGG